VLTACLNSTRCNFHNLQGMHPVVYSEHSNTART
jgi:hypothetical protein